MEIIKGTHAGRTARLIQFGNDWIMADIEGGSPNAVVKPPQVRLTAEEMAGLADHVGVGSFWDEWRLNEDTGTFTAVRRRGGRAAQ